MYNGCIKKKKRKGKVCSVLQQISKEESKEKKVVIKDRYRLKMDAIKSVRVKVWRRKVSINLTMLSFCVLGCGFLWAFIFFLCVSVWLCMNSIDFILNQVNKCFNIIYFSWYKHSLITLFSFFSSLLSFVFIYKLLITPQSRQNKS